MTEPAPEKLPDETPMGVWIGQTTEAGADAWPPNEPPNDLDYNGDGHAASAGDFIADQAPGKDGEKPASGTNVFFWIVRPENGNNETFAMPGFTPGVTPFSELRVALAQAGAIVIEDKTGTSSSDKVKSVRFTRSGNPVNGGDTLNVGSLVTIETDDQPTPQNPYPNSGMINFMAGSSVGASCMMEPSATSVACFKKVNGVWTTTAPSDTLFVADQDPAPETRQIGNVKFWLVSTSKLTSLQQDYVGSSVTAAKMQLETYNEVTVVTEGTGSTVQAVNLTASETPLRKGSLVNRGSEVTLVAPGSIKGVVLVVVIALALAVTALFLFGVI